MDKPIIGLMENLTEADGVKHSNFYWEDIMRKEMTLKTRIDEVRALAEKAPQGKYTCERGYLYLGDDPEQIVHSDFDVDENGFSFLAASPEMVAIINELLPKLDIARKFIDEVAHDLAIDIKRREQADKALKLTDIGDC